MKINNVARILFGSVLFCGLIACSADKSGGPTTPWKLHDPHIERSGNRERLEMAQALNEPLSTSDAVIFEESAEELEGVTLSVTSKCQRGNIEYANSTNTWALRQRFQIYEFLPTEAIFDKDHPLDKAVSCSFRFEGQNPAGSTHSFSVTFSKISIEDGNLWLSKEGEPLDQNSLGLIEVKQSTAAQYTLPALMNPLEKYLVTCENKIGVAKATPSEIGLNQFAMQIRSSVLDHSNICRFFRVDAEGHIVSFSDLVSWREFTPEIKVEKVQDSISDRVIVIPGMTTPISYMLRLSRAPNSVYKITNLSNRKISLVIPAGYNQSYLVKVYLRPDRAWGLVRFPSQAYIYSEPNLPQRQPSMENVHADIGPGEVRYLEMGPLADFSSCDIYNYRTSAASFRPEQSSGLIFYVVDNPSAALAIPNFVEMIQIEPAYQKYVVQDTAGWHMEPAPAGVEDKPRITLSCSNEIKPGAPADNKSAGL